MVLTPECLKAHILFQKVTSCGKIASFFGGELLEFSRNSRLTTTQSESDQPWSAVVLNPGCMGQSIRKPKKKKACSTAEQTPASEPLRGH